MRFLRRTKILTVLFFIGNCLAVLWALDAFYGVSVSTLSENDNAKTGPYGVVFICGFCFTVCMNSVVDMFLDGSDEPYVGFDAKAEVASEVNDKDASLKANPYARFFTMGLIGLVVFFLEVHGV